MLNKKRWALLLAAVMSLQLCAGCANSGARDMSTLTKAAVSYHTVQSAGTLSPSAQETEGWTEAAENEYLMLFYRKETAAVRLFDKRTGKWWSSNPEGGEKLSNAASSQVTVSTINSKGSINEYSSAADAVAKNQVTFETANNGLTVCYTFGNVKPDLSTVPVCLTAERMEELQQRVEQAGGKATTLTRRYNQRDDGIWERKSAITSDQAQKLKELFALIDYTAQELAEDAQATGSAAVEESNSFMIPLEYVLEQDSLVVRISGQRMEYPRNEIIREMKVLGYFGALAENADGYFFVPSGSGALANTKAQKSNAAACTIPLYGKDYTIPVESKSGEDAENLMPVFGISREKDGVFAIIEDNDAVASVELSKTGDIDAWNTIGASFAVSAVENIGLSTDAIAKFYVTSEERYAGDTTLRYIFLTEENHTYAGMASVYRAYLDAQGTRERLKEASAVPLFIETVGAVTGKTSTLGFVHEQLLPLTTFEDDAAVLQDLQKNGVSNVNLVLSGWLEGGENPTLADGVTIPSVLGGVKGLQKLQAEAEKVGYRVFPKVFLNSFSANSSLLSQNRYASKTLGSEKSQIPSFDKLTGVSLSDGLQRYLVSPSSQWSLSQSLLSSLEKNRLSSLLVGDLSTTVYSDYSKTTPALRQNALVQSSEILSAFSGKLDGLMLTAPNVTAAFYSQTYTDVPSGSGSYMALERSVPFYQMVYHGYADYSATALNFSADYETALLKCAEYGSCLKFRFVYEGDVAKNAVETAGEYAASYDRWKDQLPQAYTWLNELLEPVRCACMVGHSQLAEGVYRTDYDNGMRIYVNYTEQSVVADGVSVPAKQAIRVSQARTEGGQS